jgi:transposase
VGADLGPSTVAVVTDTEVALEHFCDALHPQWRRIRRLQRRLDRQHRAGSPGCFDEHGRHGSGRCTWSRSRRGRLTAAALSEAQRRIAAHRRSLHGNLVNRLLSHGTDVRIELLSYRAWQRGHYSRSVRDRAPGLFVSLLRRKAESAGGKVVELDTRATALSQVCVCGRRERKPLELRIHACPECGLVAQRDVFSALLARHVDPRTHALDAEAAARELRSRHDIAGRTASSTGLNRRLGWHAAARTETSVRAGRPHPARSSGEAA